MAAKQTPSAQADEKHTNTSAESATNAAERRRLAEGYETRADLYAEAKRRGIEGRSKMTKAELRDALRDG